MQNTALAIEADGLTKRFGQTVALDGIDLAVASGTVCGLLGPNGAGKTTMVRILATLLRADAGVARVAGADVAGAAHEVRCRIGLSGQEPAVDEILSGHQNLVMFARLNRFSRRQAAARADELLKLMGLVDAADRAVKHYSGGMRRCLDLAATLILAPQVLFLDEPTTGLDPRNRNEVWTAIRALVAGGTTVLLTTQYLDEADRLADQIVVIDSGRVIAQSSPDQLKAHVGGDRLDVVVQHQEDLARAADVIAGVTGSPLQTVPSLQRISVPVTDRVTALAESLTALAAIDVDVADIAVRRPTLDDVFLHLTGHRADVDPSPDQASTAAMSQGSTV